MDWAGIVALELILSDSDRGGISSAMATAGADSIWSAERQAKRAQRTVVKLLSA